MKTEELKKEFDESAEAASVARSKMFISILIVGQLVIIASHTRLLIHSGAPKSEAISRALASLANLKDQYPDHASNIDPVVEVYEKILAATKPSQDEPKVEEKKSEVTSSQGGSVIQVKKIDELIGP